MCSCNRCTTFIRSLIKGRMTPNTREGIEEVQKRIAMYFYNAEHPEVYTEQEIEKYTKEVDRIMSIFTPFLHQELQKAREEAWQEAVDLADKIELREPDGGTKQWMAFKAFRNTLRDKMNQSKLDQPTPTFEATVAKLKKQGYTEEEIQARIDVQYNN